MTAVLGSSWALLLGMFLLMVGNGLQGSLLGVRGAIEGFDPATLSLVISGYFVGILGGSLLAPRLIRRVGHVRVFAAMGSLVSAAFILYAAAPYAWAWSGLRILVGFAFAAIYIVAESWMNDAADNKTRGKALSLYMVVQMLGIIAAQAILGFGDPSGYDLFVLISVLVSIAFMPILLSASPAPVLDETGRMTLRRLYRTSPLGCVGALIVGAVYSVMFGMAAVFGTERGLSVAEIATFVSAIYLGGLVLQWPVGWVSDRMDRRRLIIVVAAICAAASAAGAALGEAPFALYASAFVIGGTVNPLYALMIAHTNDYLEQKDMPAAAAALMLIGGIGAIGGPLIVGQLMDRIGPVAFFLHILLCMAAIVGYGLYRTTKRRAKSADETGPFAAVAPNLGPLAVGVVRAAAEEAAAEPAGQGAERPPAVQEM